MSPAQLDRLIARSREVTDRLDVIFNRETLLLIEIKANETKDSKQKKRVRIRVASNPKSVLAWAIGQRIRASREQLEWTQQELADFSGIARANIARLEGGKHPPKAETINRVAKALRMNPAELLKEPEPIVQTDEDKRWIESDLKEWSSL
jgi:DNA-binding XRE family transcriptional regulator